MTGNNFHRPQIFYDCIKLCVCVCVLVALLRPALCDPHGPVRLLCPWNSPGKNTGMGSQFHLQGIFPDLGFEPRSPALQADSLPSESSGKPYVKLGVALNQYFSNLSVPFS